MKNDNYPIGSSNDPSAPYNEPLATKVNVEVGVELGLFVTVEVYKEEQIEEEVRREIANRYELDDAVINSITIYQHDFPYKQE